MTGTGFFASRSISLSFCTSAVPPVTLLCQCHYSTSVLWGLHFLQSSWFWRKGKLGVLVPQKSWSFPLDLWAFRGAWRPPGQERNFHFGLDFMRGQDSAIWGSLEIIWEWGLAWQLGWRGAAASPISIRSCSQHPARCQSNPGQLGQGWSRQLCRGLLKRFVRKFPRKSTHPRDQEVVYLVETGDECRKLASLGLGWFASVFMNRRALCQPGLVGEEGGWGIAATPGTGLCMLASAGGREKWKTWKK